MKSFYIRASVYPNTTNTANNLCRIILVYDKQTNASLPSITTLLDTANSHSQLNKDNRDRYDIIMDKVYAVGQQVAVSGASISPAYFSLKKFKKLKDRLVQFNQTNGSTIADITTGGLYLVFVGNVTTGTTAASITYTCRINYTDK